MKLTAPLALTLATFLPGLTFSQNTVSQAIEWASLTNNVKVSKHLSIIAEGQFRFAGAFEPMQFQFRTGADIHVTKNLSIVPLGYVYTWNPTYGKQPNKFVNNEHRLWEQVTYKHRIGRLHVAHRGRLEQRYIQVHSMNNGEVVNEGFDYFANRFRYRLMVNFPLNHAEMGAKKTLFASFYNEVFTSWGPKVTYHGPDQNRLYMGLGYHVSKDLTVNTGCLYQMLKKANNTMQENNIGVQMMVIYNIDLTK